VVVGLSSDGSVVVCPFYRSSRDFTTRFCHNLRSGVPLCVVSGFFEDWDEEFERARMVMSDAEARVKFNKPIVEYCGSVVRSDVYFAVKKSGCFFSGLCVHPSVHGFGACCGCSRWK
jgi:hypothetical protein